MGSDSSAAVQIGRGELSRKGGAELGLGYQRHFRYRDNFKSQNLLLKQNRMKIEAAKGVV